MSNLLNNISSNSLLIICIVMTIVALFLSITVAVEVINNYRRKRNVNVIVENSEDEYDSDNEVEVDIYDFFTSNFGYCIPPIQMQSLEEWLKDFGGNTEIVKFAIKKCCDNNVRTFSYLEGILQAWKSKGFKTIEECKNELRGKKNVENEPEWMDKTIEKKEASAEDKKKIEEMLKEFM